MKVSARNRLPGRVEEILTGTVMAHITVPVGDNLIESVTTRRSVDELASKVSDEVKILIKSTEAMIPKD